MEDYSAVEDLTLRKIDVDVNQTFYDAATIGDLSILQELIQSKDLDIDRKYPSRYFII